MSPEPVLGDHDDAVVTALRTIEHLPIGDGDATGLTPPYAVVYRGPTMHTGPIDAPNDDAYVDYQVSCVGDSRRAAATIADAVRAKLAGGITVEGRSFPRMQLLGGRGPSQNIAGGEEWFLAIEEVRVWSTPDNSG